MDYLVSYVKGMGITELLRYLTGLSPNGEENTNINLVRDTTWLIQNPQWGSNLHWISAAPEYEVSDVSGGPEKAPYIIYWDFFDTKYNDHFNENYNYVMQHYCVTEEVAMKLADTCDQSYNFYIQIVRAGLAAALRRINIES